MTAYLGYLIAFVLSTVTCFGAAWRARSVPHTDTRRALMAFFLASGAWAGTYVGFLLVSSAFGKHFFYQGSLIIGFGTVFAWGWFCSAYTGRSLHRYRTVQWFGVAIYLAVTALKLANPWHGLYYELVPTGTAFGLAVSHGPLYWVAMSLAYALAATGYLMLFELFLKTDVRTGPLVVLTGLTALPAGLNVTGHLNPELLDITHEPLGVAVFAVGVLFVYTYHFSTVQTAGTLDSPSLVLGRERQIRDYGGDAPEMVPELGPEAVGKPLGEVLPGLAGTLSREHPDRSEHLDRREHSGKRNHSGKEISSQETSAQDNLGEEGAGREGPLIWTRELGESTRHFRVLETALEGARGRRLVVLSDVTERTRRKNQLEKQNDLFAKAQDLAQVGAWELGIKGSPTSSDLTFGDLTWTDKVYEIHGIDKSEGITLRQVLQMYPDQSRVIETLRHAIREQRAFDEEVQVIRPDGEVRWASVHGEPQVGPDGETIRVRGAFEDITPRKRREQMLRRLREKYQGLLEGAPDAIFVADAETGKIIEANEEASDLIGAPTGQIIGRHQSTLHPPEDREKYRALFENAIEEVSHRSMSFEELSDGSQTYVQTDDGDKVPVSISATIVELGGEQPQPALVGIFRDISERKKREQRLREAKKKAELSKLEAEEASRMKSAMLANMSHEIRTPLTGVIGFAEAIGDEIESATSVEDQKVRTANPESNLPFNGDGGREEQTQKEQAEEEQLRREQVQKKMDVGQVSRFAGLIEDSGRRLLDTLDAVLNLSKLEAGQMALQAQPVDLARQARKVAEELEPEARENGLELRTDAQESLARADEGGVQIVLQNLLSNAIKYTEEGSVVVRTYRKSECAIIEVEDTGIGMNPEVAESLFEPFRQASEGMCREYEGTGIGLAVTKKATEKMGGSITVDTQKGEGSRFTVRLPVVEEGGR